MWKVKPLSPLISYYGVTSGDDDDAPGDDVTDPDSDILDMEPSVQPKPRYDSKYYFYFFSFFLNFFKKIYFYCYYYLFLRLLELTEDMLLKHCSVESTKNITILSLHDCGLSRLKNINHMANLKKLVVSFNNLTKLDDITSMVC